MRIYAAILISIAFLLAPMAQAAHIVSEAACEAVHAPYEQSPVNGGDIESHAHHAHGCGACHLHLVQKDAAPFRIAAIGRGQTITPFVEDLILRETGGPYRPPRV
jgi:hypothetical protein